MCTGQSNFMDGDMCTCELKNPLAAAYLNGFLYISDEGKVRKIDAVEFTGRSALLLPVLYFRFSYFWVYDTQNNLAVCLHYQSQYQYQYRISLAPDSLQKAVYQYSQYRQGVIDCNVVIDVITTY